MKFFVRVHEVKSATGQISKYSHSSVLIKQPLLSKIIVLSIKALSFVGLGDFELRLRYSKRSSNFHCCNNMYVCNVCMDKCNVYKCII